eukprot:752711-Amphidinium_carterae.1
MNIGKNIEHFPRTVHLLILTWEMFNVLVSVYVTCGCPLLVSPGGEVSATASAAWQRQAEVMVYGKELAGQSLQSHVKPKLANRDRC